MDKAKAAVSSFISKSGHHDTTVNESVAPAVTQEQIKPTRHEEMTEAVDREVHQDHYHTTVQPIQHQEVLPEKHSHNMGAVQERQFEHDDAGQTRQKLESDAARFRDTSTTHDTRHTTSAAPVVEGEHVHHHVHERVQPIVHKETVQPEVVHTTVPIHELHKAEAEHHGTSVLPMKTLDDFKSGGGILTGGQQKAHEAYEGDPRPYNKAMQTERTDADEHFHEHDGLHDHQRALGRSGGDTTATGPHTSNLENKMDPRVDSDRDGRAGVGFGSNTTAVPRDANVANAMDSRVDARDGSHRGAEAATGIGAGGIAGGAYEAGRHHEETTSGSSGFKEYGRTSRSSGPTSGFNEHSLGQSSGRTGIGSGTSGMGSNARSGVFSNDPTTATEMPRQDDATSANPQTSSRSGLVGSSNNTDNTRSDVSRVEQADTTARTPETTNAHSKMSDEEPKNEQPQESSGGDDDHQGPNQGRDPNVVDVKDKKLTGTGAPGSHSALFGLTPDGHKETEADATTTAPKAAHTGEKKSATGDGGEETEDAAEGKATSEDAGSRQPEGAGVKDQMDDPKVAEKGHDGAAETTTDDSGKPGGGSTMTPSQGSGTVGEDA